MTTPFIEALQRIQALTAECPGDDIAAARVIGTVNAIAYGALLAVTEGGTKPKQETTTVKTTFDLEMTLDLSTGCGIFGHDIEAIATIEYEVENYRHGDYAVTGWALTHVRFPNVPGSVHSMHYLWAMFNNAVYDKSKFVDEAIRNHIEDNEEWVPAANLMSAVS